VHKRVVDRRLLGSSPDSLPLAAMFAAAARGLKRTMTFVAPRRMLSAEAPAAPTAAPTVIVQRTAWWEPVAQLTVAGGIVAAAISSAYWSATASASAANAEKAIAGFKMDQEKALAAEKAAMEKALAAEKAAMEKALAAEKAAMEKAFAAEKEVLKAQSDSVKAQSWAAYLLPTLTSVGAFCLGGFALYAGKKA
jgi:colicin import membrane protein